MLARGCVLAAVILVLAGCTSVGDKTGIAPTRPTGVVSSPPHCDGSQVTDRYAEFASAFNRGELALAVDQFVSGHPFVWWDPSDPLGKVQVLDEIRDHFGTMYALGVRLPISFTIQGFSGPDANGQDPSAGTGGFDWDDGHGFWGKGGIDCASGKFVYMVIDGWTRAIAGRAPLAPSPSS